MPKSTKTRNELLAAGAVLFCIVFIAVLRLPLPFEGDQALFFYGATQMLKGALYYIDFWDWKAPGIYVFFYTAVRLFGASETAVHLFELIWMSALALSLIVVCRGRFRFQPVVYAVPILAVGVYYLRAIPWHATQLEVVVGLPLLVCLGLLSATYSTSWRLALGYFTAGFAAALTTVFKPALAPIPVALWMVAASLDYTQARRGARQIMCYQALPFALGVCGLWIVVAASFFEHGALHAFLVSSFSIPLEGLMEADAGPTSRLVDCLWFAIRTFGPYSPWIAIGVLTVLVGFQRADRVLVLAVVWIAVGIPVLLIQRFAWWDYHVQIFYVPVAIAAAFGMDKFFALLELGSIGYVWRRLGSMKTGLLFAVIMIFAVATHIGRWSIHPLAWMRAMANKGEWITAYQDQFAEYKQIRCNGAFLNNPGALPGPIYVFGHAYYLIFSARKQSHPIRGWALRTLPLSKWREIESTFTDRPPAYVFILGRYRQYIARGAPQTLEWIEANYQQMKLPACGVSADDQWYRLAK